MQLSDLNLNRNLYKETNSQGSYLSVDNNWIQSQFMPDNNPMYAGGGNAAYDVNTNTLDVSGGKIRTGAIDSTNYTYTSGVYSDTGTELNLDDGIFRSKNFAINAAGDAFFKGTVTGGTIIGSTIETSTSGARVVIDGGNNITLYDDSTGGGGTVTGNSSEINFLRVYDNSKGFVMRQRAGKNNNFENVLEIFGLTPAANYSNYLYFGRQGENSSSAQIGYIEMTANILSGRSYESANGTFIVSISTNGILPSYGNIAATDARVAFGNAGKSGVVSLLSGSGTDGLAGFGYQNRIDIYSTSGGLYLSNSLIPDADNSYNIGSSGAQIAKAYFKGELKIPVGTNLY